MDQTFLKYIFYLLIFITLNIHHQIDIIKIGWYSGKLIEHIETGIQNKEFFWFFNRIFKEIRTVYVLSTQITRSGQGTSEEKFQQNTPRSFS
jgi:hypothetical protein